MKPLTGIARFFFFACPKTNRHSADLDAHRAGLQPRGPNGPSQKAPAGICVSPRHPGQNGRNILRVSRSVPNDSAHLQAGIKGKK